MTIPDPVVDAGTLNRFLVESFPDAPRLYRVEEVTDLGVRMRLPIGEEHQRPGGTVAGPVLMGLADGSAWLATLSRIGLVALSVTSTLHIDFLRKPELVDLVADAELLRLGRRSSVTIVRMHSGDDGPLVAHATVGYAIPA